MMNRFDEIDSFFVVKQKSLSFEDAKAFIPLGCSDGKNQLNVCKQHNEYVSYDDGMAGVLFLRSLGSRVLLDLNGMKIKVFDD